MVLFPLFLLVLIINLLWLIQFIADIKSESIVICLNVFMVFSWLTFCIVYNKKKVHVEYLLGVGKDCDDGGVGKDCDHVVVLDEELGLELVSLDESH